MASTDVSSARALPWSPPFLVKPWMKCDAESRSPASDVGLDTSSSLNKLHKLRHEAAFPLGIPGPR